MGKGTLLLSKGAGLYSVQLDHGDAEYAARVADFDAKIAQGNIDAAEVGVTLDAAEALLNQYSNDLDIAISFLQGNPEDEELKKTVEHTTALVNAQRKVVRSTAQALNVINLNNAGLLADLNRLQDAHPSPAQATQDIWCAEFNEELTGDLATIEIGREAGVSATTQILLPGEAKDYSPSRDGQLLPIEMFTPASAFYSYAMLPGSAKWKPRFRTGFITAITGGLCDINVDLVVVSRQLLNINQTPTLSGVPVVYLTCNDGAFEVGDHVVIGFADFDWAQPTVIGFVSDPRSCIIPPTPTPGEWPYDLILKYQIYETTTSQGYETFIWCTYNFETNSLVEVGRYKQQPLYNPSTKYRAMMLIANSIENLDVMASEFAVGDLMLRDETTVNEITKAEMEAYMTGSYDKATSPLASGRVDEDYYATVLMGDTSPDVWLDSYLIKFDRDSSMLGALYIQPYGNFINFISVNETHFATIEQTSSDILKVFEAVIEDGQVADTTTLTPLRTKILDTATLSNLTMALHVISDFVYLLIEQPATAFVQIVEYNWVDDIWTVLHTTSDYAKSYESLAYSIVFHNNSIFATYTEFTSEQAKAIKLERDPDTEVWSHSQTNILPLEASGLRELSQFEVIKFQPRLFWINSYSASDGDGPYYNWKYMQYDWATDTFTETDKIDSRDGSLWPYRTLFGVPATCGNSTARVLGPRGGTDSTYLQDGATKWEILMADVLAMTSETGTILKFDRAIEGTPSDYGGYCQSFILGRSVTYPYDIVGSFVVKFGPDGEVLGAMKTLNADSYHHALAANETHVMILADTGFLHVFERTFETAPVATASALTPVGSIDISFLSGNPFAGCGCDIHGDYVYFLAGDVADYYWTLYQWNWKTGSWSPIWSPSIWKNNGDPTGNSVAVSPEGGEIFLTWQDYTTGAGRITRLVNSQPDGTGVWSLDATRLPTVYEPTLGSREDAKFEFSSYFPDV